MSKPRHVELAELAGVDVQEVETATGAPDWGGYLPNDPYPYMNAIPDWFSERLETRWRLWLVDRVFIMGAGKDFVNRLEDSRGERLSGGLSSLYWLLTVTNRELATAALETLRAEKVKAG